MMIVFLFLAAIFTSMSALAFEAYNAKKAFLSACTAGFFIAQFFSGIQS